MQDKKKSFEVFRQSYHANAAVEENKKLLRQRYTQAKGMGQKVNAARSTINTINTLYYITKFNTIIIVYHPKSFVFVIPLTLTFHRVRIYVIF